MSFKIDKRKFLSRVTKISAAIWVGCVIGVFTILGYVAGIRKEALNQFPAVFTSLFLGLLYLGSFAFLIGSVSFTAQILVKKSQKKRNSFIFLIKLFFILAILPIYLLICILKPLEIIKRIKHVGIKGLLHSLHLKPILGKAIAILVVGFIVLPIWIGGYAIVDLVIKNQLGYWPKPIPISGTGSMYPTFPKGQGKTPQEQAKEIVGTPGMLPYPNGLLINGKRFFNHEITRDDIVVIDNNKIREITQKMYGIPSGLIKRVIAIGGDTIELKSGIVYLNDKPLKEPYTAKARSTFGESFLQECKKFTIPANSIFVMGDNRKGSGDSREDGPFELKAAKFVLSLEKQKGLLDKNWRNTSSDFNESSKIKLDKTKYLELLNEKRKKAGVKSLKYQPLLEKSAFKRGEIILKYNDFSYEATRSGYTQLKAMNDAGYSNIVYGEGPNQGYYEANELIDNQFEFPKTKDFLLEKDYQEIGIAEVEGNLNGCPAQIIVQHFAGYVSPNYSKEVIESWDKSLSDLRNVQLNWQNLKNNNYFYSKYKNDIDRINEIIGIRVTNIESVVATMRANRWLSADQDKYTRTTDKALFDEAESLATKLNSSH